MAGIRHALSSVRALAAAGVVDEAKAARPKVDPRARITYQPHRCQAPAPDEPLEVLIGSIRRVMAARQGAAEGGADQGDPERGAWACQKREVRKGPPARHGQKGLTANGARQIQRACALLHDDQGCLAFWTVTLPDASIRELVARDLWPQFQTRIRDLLARALKARGLEPRALGVVELHPARSMRERIPLPHLHVVFHGRKARNRAWLLTPADLDGIIRDAARYAGIQAPDTKAAGNVQPVRKNCGAYLAKYCVKNRRETHLRQVPGNLPRVWWFWTAPLRREVLDHVIELCWGFVSWLHRKSPDQLAALGVVRLRFQLADPAAPSTFALCFRSPDCLRRAPEIWCAERMEIESRQTFY